jgi:CRISPR system Cascade subunit CasD
MPCFLTFTLAAPLASFGGVAVGERRGSDGRPAKSAILGLLAAALGIEREDEDEKAHAALALEFFCAVRIEDFKVRAPRRLMTDYQTAQSPPRGRNQRFATRRDEVADKQNLGTILSYREYRSDCSFSIALWPRVSSLRFSLEDLAKALREPIFVPYAGRRACPLMLPMQPLVLDASDVRAAFEMRDERCEKQRAFLERYGLLATAHAIAHDADAVSGVRGRRERRRDQILHRGRLQFGLRDEVLRPWDGGGV